MNRHWATFFGRGLVETLDDFGVQGATPTHPELLDWLATEFHQRSWGLKEMHRLMVTSATYRQGATVGAKLLARDPVNELLARGPRFRLSAETLRDVALAASGLLQSRLGGPSVFPPQPEALSRFAYGGAYEASPGAGRYRRGLYTFWKRTAPYATFLTFDAPSREETCIRRSRTNTPLQALTLLNDAVFLEAAQALARRTILEGGRSEEGRLRRLFLLALGREPEAAESVRVLAFRRSQHKILKEQFEDGEKAIRSLVGESPELEAGAAPLRALDLPWIDLASWVLVARAILNLDELVNKG